LIFNLTTVNEHDDDGQAAGRTELETIIRQQTERELYERFRRLTQAILDHYPTIDVVKEGIASKDFMLASEAWFELSEEEQRKLWVAPSKGGVFTTAERETMKSSEFRKAHFGEGDGQ
jgi:hypothetical protein